MDFDLTGIIGAKRSYEETIDAVEQLLTEENFNDVIQEVKRRITAKVPDVSLERFDREESDNEDDYIEVFDDDDDDDDVSSVCSDEFVEDFMEDESYDVDEKHRIRKEIRYGYELISQRFADFLYIYLKEWCDDLRTELDDLETDGDYSSLAMKEKADNIFITMGEINKLQRRIERIYTELQPAVMPDLFNTFLDEVEEKVRAVLVARDHWPDDNSREEYIKDMYKDALEDAGKKKELGDKMVEELEEEFYQLDEQLEQRDELRESVGALISQVESLVGRDGHYGGEYIALNPALGKLQSFAMLHGMDLDEDLAYDPAVRKINSIENLIIFFTAYQQVLKEIVDVLTEKGADTDYREHVPEPLVNEEVQELAGIRKEQQQVDLVFDRDVFKNLCEQIAHDFRTDTHFTPEALEALQTGAEDYLVDLYKKSIKTTILRNKEEPYAYGTVPNDVNFVLRFNEE